MEARSVERQIGEGAATFTFASTRHLAEIPTYSYLLAIPDKCGRISRAQFPSHESIFYSVIEKNAKSSFILCARLGTYTWLAVAGTRQLDIRVLLFANSILVL